MSRSIRERERDKVNGDMVCNPDIRYRITQDTLQIFNITPLLCVVIHILVSPKNVLLYAL